MTLWQDVRFAVRSVRRAPRVGVTVLLTLALGIGANTAIFSIVNAALLRPLPYAEPGQLVQLGADLPGVGARNVGFSVPELEDLKDRSGIIADASVSWEAPVNLTGGDHPERIDFLAVSPNYFTLLGARPEIGRLFDDRDVARGFAEAAVISDGFWHREFGADPNIVGRRIRLDNDLYTIVGVLPPEYRSPVPVNARPVELWATAGFKADPFPPPARSTRFLPAIVARLRPGISVKQAQAQLAVFAAALRQQYATDYPPASGWTLTLTPLKDVVVGNSSTLLVSLLLAVGFILLIACVNVANILLANAASRRGEIAVRLAVGASRGRILRQLLTEAAVLSLAATVIGTFSAAISLRFLVGLLPSQVPHVNAIAMDARVLLFSLGVALVTTIVFGLVPAWKSSGTGADVDYLRGRGSSASGKDTKLGKMLIGAEVALSVMLLAGAGLLLRTFWDLLHVDPGFQPRHLIAANVWLPVPNDPTTDIYRQADRRVLLEQESVRRLREIPGVESAALSSLVPLANTVVPTGIRVEGADERGDAPTAVRVAVTPEFFQTMGARLTGGRSFQDTDTLQTPVVAVVNEAAARKFWGKRSPIGMRVRSSRPVVVNGTQQQAPWITVVGVVNNLKLGTLDEQDLPYLFTSQYQTPPRLYGILVRATGDKAEIGRGIERAIQQVDPNLPVANVSEMSEIVSLGVGDRRFAAWLLAIFAAVALVLTSVGIYGVTSYMIARRTKELGIRSALGATHSHLLRMVLITGMWPVAAGLAAGLVGAIASGRMIAALLYSVSATDATVLAVSAATVVLVGIAANYIPARRAARIDPMIALRVE